MAKKQKQDKTQQAPEVQDEQVQPGQVVSAEEFEKLKVDFDNLQNQLKRAVADYQNLEKRVAEGRAEFNDWAKSNLVMRVLTVSDHLDKVIFETPDNEKSSGWFKGIEMVAKELRRVLEEDGGLKIMEVQPMSDFDPGMHEAVDVQDGEDGKILNVVQNGYMLNGKIIKPARVVVGRKEN